MVPGSNVARLDSLEFSHVACGLELRICQGQTQSNLAGMEGMSCSFLPSIASEETGMEALKADDDHVRDETRGLKRLNRLVLLSS